MIRVFLRAHLTPTLVALGLCVWVLALSVTEDLAAAASGVAAWTETGNGTPARPVPPQSAVKNFNPKQTTVFTEKETFLDAIICGTVSLESFESLPATNQIDSSTVTVSDFTITTDNPPELGLWNRLYQGAFATHGTQWLGIEESRLVVPQVTTLSFNAPINHFGLYATDFGDFGDGNLVFASDAGDEATAAFSGEPSGNRQFFGIINSAGAFRTVTLTHSIAGEFFGLDEIYYCMQGVPDTPLRRRSSGRVTPD